MRAWLLFRGLRYEKLSDLFTSMNSYIYIINVRVYRIVKFILGTLPNEGSFAMHATLLNHVLYGASYPRGGASEIAFHMIPIIERNGGRALVRAPVKQILIENGVVRGE